MWKSIKETKPPLNQSIKTIIIDEKGVRNEQFMKFDGNLWWAGDMYVYYRPTHWDLVN